MGATGDLVGDSPSGAATERRTLRRELDKWREFQQALLPHVDFPDLDGHDTDDDEDEDASSPEDEPLAFPSDFSSAERGELGLEALAVFERRIRLGHAYDLLDAVKMSLNHQGAFLFDKQKHARGQKDNTRSQKQVSNAAARTRVLAGLYNYNRDRLLTLSELDTTDVLQAIDTAKDLKSKNWRKAREQGDSREEQAWIWTVVPPQSSGTNAAEWQLEGTSINGFEYSSY